MDRWFFVVDVLLALAGPVFVHVMCRRGRFPATYRRLYWLGVAIGTTWEFAFFLTGPSFSDDPTWETTATFPLPAVLQPALHALWDGSLFLVGVLLVARLCRPPVLTRFRWTELGVMAVWGQVQELAVELAALGAGTWTYVEKPWNPVLFRFGSGQVTAVPQLVWLVASVAFYLGALAITRHAAVEVGQQPGSPRGAMRGR